MVLVRHVVVTYFIKRKPIVNIFNGKLRIRFHNSVKYKYYGVLSKTGLPYATVKTGKNFSVYFH